MKSSQQSESKSVADIRLEALVDEWKYSEITGKSVHTARRDRLLGTGCPYVKLGALVRYRPVDIRRYIERNLRGSGGQEA
jgi:hypothetical protein